MVNPRVVWGFSPNTQGVPIQVPGRRKRIDVVINDNDINIIYWHWVDVTERDSDIRDQPGDRAHRHEPSDPLI